MYKRSKQRDMILDYLKNTKSHPTPEQIFDNLRIEHPELGIATVYRNLKTLHSQGLIRRLSLGEIADRYDADMSEHYHFLCECCGKVGDLYQDDLNLELKSDIGMTVKKRELYVYGVCPECNKKIN